MTQLSNFWLERVKVQLFKLIKEVVELLGDQEGSVAVLVQLLLAFLCAFLLNRPRNL